MGSAAVNNRNGIAAYTLFMPTDIYYEAGFYWISDYNHRIVKVSLPP